MPDMIEKKLPSALPLYCAAGAFLLGALVLPVYRLWALSVCAGFAVAAYVAAAKLIPLRTVLVPAPATIFATGEAALDTVLAKAEQDIASLSALNKRIEEPELSRNIARMEKAGREILAQIAAHPQKAKSIRKFAAYYLPTSVKLLTTYAELSATGAQGENAQNLLRDIRKNADTIAGAFEAQLDALFADKVLDVSSDLVVLDSMMKGDGLTGADDISSLAQKPQGPTLTL